ncbi:MAG: hypothetical protein ACI9KN_000111 [Gammaproteobacteria bacterium]|jgi:uncharacterized protein YaiL (DUF2058 family)
MASLQDQLLKAGIIDKNKAKKVKNDQHKQAKTTRKMGGKTVNEAKAAVLTEQAKKLERDRALNMKKQQEANQKAVVAQIKQLIDLNKIDGSKGDIHYSFVYASKVKNIYVTEELRDHLSQGQLAIVSLLENKNQKFEIVPAAVAEKIAQRDSQYIVQLNDKHSSDKIEDDAYADYQIPDDLMW